ncbi:hypothetical protein ADMFC3_27740 [Geovibrio sp. ADMFC3]
MINIVKSIWREILFEDMLALEKYSVGVHPSHKTAFWSWAFKPAPGEHKIFVGANVSRLALFAKQEQLVRAMLYHEISHSLWTEKDIEGTDKWCKTNDVPFRLYNLFEDVRIEEKFRRIFNKDFEWECCLQKGDLHVSPENILYLLKYYGGDRGKLVELRKGTLVELDLEEDVSGYFARIIACKTSEELRPVLLDWCKEFPDSRDHFQPDEQQSEDILSSKEAERMEQESQNIFEAPESDDIGDDIALTSFSVGKIMSDRNRGGAADGYEKYVPLIAKLFQERKGYLSTESSQKRLSLRGLNGTSDKLYRKKIIKKPDKKTINLIVDTSGSMGGTPIANARAFALILNALANSGKIEGQLILTQVQGTKGVTETVKFPVSEEKILSIPANGSAENIAGTINLTKPLLKRADYNFFFTDGDICDEPVDKKRLASEGIYTFGLYVGTKNVNLERWFDRTIIKSSLKELIDELLRRIR